MKSLINLHKKKNKRGQFGIVTFVGLFLVLLFLAPILLKMVREPISKFSDAIGNQNEEAAAAVDSIEGTFTNLWDMVILIAFLINILLLFISSFFIDTNPIFFVFYILTVFLLVVFAPNILDAVNRVWDEPAFNEETGIHLVLTSFLLNNFGAVVLSIIILSGIIMYAKIKLFPKDGF
jgi:hypothetical protein